MEKIRLLVDDLIRLTNSDQIEWDVIYYRNGWMEQGKTSFKGISIEINHPPFHTFSCSYIKINDVQFRVGFWQGRKLLKALNNASKRYDKNTRLAEVKKVLDKI